MRRRGSAAAAAALAVIALAAVPAAAAGAQTRTKTFSSGNIDRLIPPGPGSAATNGSKIQVSPRGRVKDVDLFIRLSHPDIEDLYGIEPFSPPRQGTLYSADMASGGYLDGPNLGSGQPGCNGDLTRFDDEAATPISAGASPFAGSFSPDSALSNLNGAKLHGTWELEISNDLGGVDATLHCWKLRITYRPG